MKQAFDRLKTSYVTSIRSILTAPKEIWEWNNWTNELPHLVLYWSVEVTRDHKTLNVSAISDLWWSELNQIKSHAGKPHNTRFPTALTIFLCISLWRLILLTQDYHPVFDSAVTEISTEHHILTCTNYFNVFESYTAPTVPVITSLYFCNAFICTHKHFSLQLFSLVIALFNISCYDRFLQISISTDIKIVFRALQWQPRLIFP